ncbi:fimbrillin family protein [Sphingobacterium bovistauri]|uniref:Fimbrillin family protein n=1 Tax=Sphingobacterium bovistauri TaxID=2781959 RepID=A0ABS7Z8T3_9SPHI|nr:fimbrillin family protein [Sphingobacterium bovistauri]MCA5006606.1 fimbrillin family protein [Sphingobacterium bovistauri]
MNTFFLFSKRNFHVTLSILFFIQLSCEKSKFDVIESGPANLSVQLVDILTDQEDYTIDKNASTKINSMQPRIVEVPINNNLSAYVSLEEDKNNASNVILKTSNKIAAKEVKPITPGVKYGILVYEGDNLIANGHKVITAGQEAAAGAFALDGGKTYTFIGYSRNSSQTIPTVTNMSKLSTATIDNESEDLLYFRHVQKVVTGANNLKVTLRHKFTLVTTEIKVGATYAGKIQEIQNGIFAQTKSSASIKLSDSTITYPSNNVNSTIQFSTIAAGGASSIISTPNLLIAPNATNVVTYSFPSIKINNVIGKIPVTSFNMQAGKKYNLIITLDVPCSVSSFLISNRTDYLDSTNISYNRINSSQELKINLATVDNNFNIFYNDKPLFEARFQTVTLTRSWVLAWGAWSEVANTSAWSAWAAHDADFEPNGSTNIQTMKFTDNTYWGANGIPRVYQLSGDSINPVIRVTIAADGTVSLTGKKTNSSTSQIALNHLSTIALFPITNNPNDAIYNANPSTYTWAGTVETKTMVRKTMEFRMNNFTKNSNGKDKIRFKQSTQHMMPQAGESITELSGYFKPTLKVNCQ